MINLQDSSGLPLIFNSHDNSLQISSELSVGMIDRVKLDSIRSILLNRTLHYPLQVYTEYSDITLAHHASLFRTHKLHYNILILPSGLLGIEYNKTHLFSPDNDRNEITLITDIIYGSGIILTQSIDKVETTDNEPCVDFAAMYKVKKGDRIAIPQKYMYTFVNTSNNPLIIGRLFEDDGKIDYRTLKREQGMAYYFIRKNARREIVRNPRYKTCAKLKNISPLESITRYRLTSVKPLYTQVIENPERFKKLLV
jgi:oxalate decarboxylase/phosphoglucose isomerase-like protein (cupin superfamily)